MYNHASKDYVCPICLGVRGIESKDTLLLKQDLVFQDEWVSVFVNSFGMGKYLGHVIVVSNEHVENIFDLPEELASKIMAAAKNVAKAMKKALNCEGVMLLQNNEPASGQHAFHFHLHVFPRYDGDGLHQQMENKKLVESGKRKVLVEKLKAAW